MPPYRVIQIWRRILFLFLGRLQFSASIIQYGATLKTLNKNSAVAEMGDRLATIDMGRRGGGLM